MADPKVRPGEYVMRVLFQEFTTQAEKKIEGVMMEPMERSLSKSLQRGEDPAFDQLLVALGSVAEHCLPSILRTLFAWYDRQAVTWLGNLLVSGGSISSGTGSSLASSIDSMERDSISLEPCVAERRDMAVEFIFCLVLIEVLKQLPFHPGHVDLVSKIEDLAFAHFKYREGTGIHAANSLVIADLYAEVLGVLAQARFASVRIRFLSELSDLRSKEQTPFVTQSIISLLMGMKFFRIKMAPIEDFEASFQFLTECAKYFLEVKQRDIKHALAGLFVEILVPVAAAVKHEVNVPCLKSFVEMLYAPTLDMCTRSKHRLALFPLVTCLLCVSQRPFFLHNWHYFLAMCLSQLKSKEPKMSRVALESLYRLLWAYMIRIKCESNSATQSRLLSVVNSLFPKGSKGVVPRDTPLNIFVKIIQFIAQERLDFAMREIVFELLSVGRPVKIILAPERMNIGLRAFLVAADALQQKDGDPPMPRSVGIMPSGNTLLRVKKTFLNKVLTEDTARSIGMATYYPLIRKVFTDILRALDLQCGRPFMQTTIKEQEEALLTGDRKAKIDLFRTCVAAIPRLIPEGMSRTELLSLLARLTLHVDEELRGLAFQSLQSVLVDFADWRTDVLVEFIHFVSREVPDTARQQLENALRMLIQLLTSWRNALATSGPTTQSQSGYTSTPLSHSQRPRKAHQNTVAQNASTFNAIYQAEGLALLMLCSVRSSCRRLGAHMLKELKGLLELLGGSETPVIDVIDKISASTCEKVFHLLPAGEKQACVAAIATKCLDLQWLTERSCLAWYTQDEDAPAAVPIPASPLAASILQSSAAGSTSTILTDVQIEHDPWAACLKNFFEYENIPTKCPRAVMEAWSILMPKLTALYTYIDPNPVPDSRASILRSTSTTRKPLTNRSLYLKLWRNYLIFAFKTVPSNTTVSLRCLSPDIGMSSSPEAHDSRDGRSPQPLSSSFMAAVSPTALFKQMLPLIRNETVDIRELAVQSLGLCNHLAIRDVFDELSPYLREACDRKQENLRRKKRKDNLRLQVLKIIENLANDKAFGRVANMLAMSEGSVSSNHSFCETALLPNALVEFFENCKPWLELETDREGGLEMRYSFCRAVYLILNSFSIEIRENVLKKELKKHLFHLCIGWAGQYSYCWHKDTSAASTCSTAGITLQQPLDIAALQASAALLTCGSCFQQSLLAEESQLYGWIDLLLSSSNPTVAATGEETVIMLLEFNSDCGSLLDWVVSRCFAGTQQIADACFRAIVTLFSTREYPCDRYVAIINVALLYCGSSKFTLQQQAFRLLQILDKRFFGDLPSLQSFAGGCNHTSNTLDAVLNRAPFAKSQTYLSKQLSLLHPELTMPMFSEISWRVKSARPDVRQSLLRYLQPWLHNMELVEPSIPSPNSIANLKGIDYEGPVDNDRESLSSSSSCSLCGRRGNEDNDHLVRRGWGSTEATEMVLNNLLYLTAKFGEEHEREIEECWQTMCCSSINNHRVLLYYLMIVTILAPTEILPHAKRVVVYLFRARPVKLLEDLVAEMQTVESLNWLVERTEIPPFYRLSHLRKTSSYSENNIATGGGSSNIQQNASAQYAKTQSSELEKGTIHTKRRSAEESAFQQHVPPPHYRSNSSGTGNFGRVEKVRTISGPAALPDPNFLGMSGGDKLPKVETHQLEHEVVERQYSNETLNAAKLNSSYEYGKLPDLVDDYSGDHALESGNKLVPLPMPEYGGYYAPLKEFMPSQPAATFHRCNVALMFLAEIVNEGVTVTHSSKYTKKDGKFEWCSYYLPLIVHMAVLSLDHVKPIVHLHGYNLLINLLVVAGAHKDHFSIAKIMLHQQTKEMNPGLDLPGLGLQNYDMLDPATELTTRVTPAKAESIGVSPSRDASPSHSPKTASPRTPSRRPHTPINLLLVIPEPSILTTTRDLTNEEFAITFLKFLAEHRGQPLWTCEDITARVWNIRSASQILCFLQHTLRAFTLSYPNSQLERKWAQISLQIGLACSSRHYAGRSLQVYRALRVPLVSRVLCDILSRLVETVAEPGDDMQGYVTELILTLMSSVEAISVKKASLDQNMDDFEKAKPPGSPQNQMRARSGTETFSIEAKKTELSRSRSAQSLNGMGIECAADQDMLEKAFGNDSSVDVLPQVFWLATSLLESDYEYEYLLALGLLEKVMDRLQLDRFDNRDKLERVQSQLQWTNYPGVINLLLKGCTNPNTFEHSLSVLCKFIPVLDLSFVDPTMENGFPLAVMALLPFLLLHYDDPSTLCLQAAQLIAIAAAGRGEEGNQPLQHLSTVMTLYSRRSFSKESLQWTKCVVKYLSDSYTHLAGLLLSFLLEVLERGPTNLQPAVLTTLHCCFTYVDLTSVSTISHELLRAIEKHLEASQWEGALKILKLVVTRSSSLVAPPPPLSSYSGSSGPSSMMWDSVSTASSITFSSDNESGAKKELPGRTMEFSFDVSQTPIIGRRHPHSTSTLSKDENGQRPNTLINSGMNQRSGSVAEMGGAGGPGAHAFATALWKRPWHCQGRVRECLINVLNACGQRVGLPKSPSVIFSQSSELLERQSSVASSTEEVSVVNDVSIASRLEDGSGSDAQFRVFRDFDFLEYELESNDGDNNDNFNWGVRRRPLSEIGTEPETEGEADETANSRTLTRSQSLKTGSTASSSQRHAVRPTDIDLKGLAKYSDNNANTDVDAYESSDEEELNLSPLEDLSPNLLDSERPTPQPVSLNAEFNDQAVSPARSRRLSGSSIESSSEDDATPCNISPLHTISQVLEEEEEPPTNTEEPEKPEVTHVSAETTSQDQEVVAAEPVSEQKQITALDFLHTDYDAEDLV